MKAVIAIAMFVALANPVWAQNSPPVGNQFPVQAAKTGSYTVKQTDLKTVIPFNCSSPCTVTFPQSTASWPKGYQVLIQNIGPSPVTITANPTSVLYGMPLTAGNIILTTAGNFAYVQADTSNNYFATGLTGSGGGGGGGGGGGLVARYGGGTVARYGGGSVARH